MTIVVIIMSFVLGAVFVLFMLGALGQPLSVVTLVTGVIELAIAVPIWFPTVMRNGRR